MLKPLVLSIFLAAFSVPATWAAEPVPPAESQQPGRTVRGRDLMTAEEWREHRQKMQSLATPEQRRAYRAEHRKRLEARAREKGLILRDGGGWRSGRGPGPLGGARGPRP